MKISSLKRFLPAPLNAVLAILSVILLVLAFPDFEFWFLAWFALAPLFLAVEREKESWIKSLFVGWIFGTCFFFGSCWWLTFAPITYAGFPSLLAYFLLFLACLAVGSFPAIFVALFSILLKRFGIYAILYAPFLWTAIEFLRFWTTGNNWNAIAYSQAFSGQTLKYASFGGIYLIGFVLTLSSSILILLFFLLNKFLNLKESRKRSIGYILYSLLDSGNVRLLNFGGSVNLQPSFTEKPFNPYFSVNYKKYRKFVWRYKPSDKLRLLYVTLIFSPLVVFFLFLLFQNIFGTPDYDSTELTVSSSKTRIVAIQPNVPMSGLTEQKWRQLRQKHVELAENALKKLEGQRTKDDRQTIVIFPESPMNFMYSEDLEFQEFVRGFASKNNVQVLFNAAEPDAENKKYFNSAVMVDASGEKIAQYDKIYLVPFGESVPAPLQNILPAFVGNFSYGKEYDLMSLGEAKGGVMICFESHFPNHSREYVRNGADVLIEMTNDGYLGKTPVLRQHLSNAIFRAVETNRPVLRVTNVGITAYINERGEVLEPTESYNEDARIWTVVKSGGSQTFYVKYGDWFAWLCSLVSLALLFLSFRKKKNE